MLLHAGPRQSASIKGGQGITGRDSVGPLLHGPSSRVCIPLSLALSLRQINSLTLLVPTTHLARETTQPSVRRPHRARIRPRDDAEDSTAHATRPPSNLHLATSTASYLHTLPHPTTPSSHSPHRTPAMHPQSHFARAQFRAQRSRQEELELERAAGTRPDFRDPQHLLRRAH